MGIRKVVGASSITFFLLHTKSFLQFLLISIIVASPLIYYLSSGWLRNFAYHIDRELYHFLVPGALVEHSLGSSGRKANVEIERVKARDALYFAQKWLSGDVYRQLSFEGRALTRGGVKQEVDNLRRTVKKLEQAIHGEPPGPVIFPSWVAAMGPSAPGGG